MAEEKLVKQALEKLLERDPSNRLDLDGAIEELASHAPFNKMDDEDILPIAEAAFGQRPSGSSRRTGQGGGGGKPASRRQPPPDNLLTAPYRFVTVSENVALAPAAAQTPCYDFPLPEGFCGTVDVEWAFETPMLIGEQLKDKDGKEYSGPIRMDGDYVIPGASFRGMVRAAMGVVTRARLTQINSNHRYGVRDFTHPLFNDGQGAAAQKLQWPNLNAGWLRKVEVRDDNKLVDEYYELTPCDKKIVRIRALPHSFNDGASTDSGAWHARWLNTDLAKKYDIAGYARGKVFDFEDSATTSFGRDPKARPGDPTAPDWVVPDKGGRKGWFVFAAKSPANKNLNPAKLESEERNPAPGDQKKREYVFMDRPGAKAVRLREACIDSFLLINSKPGRTNPLPDGSLKVLSPTIEKGKRIPVFFAGDLQADENGVQTAESAVDVAIGLTRLFKMPHRFSVGDVRNRWEMHKPPRELGKQPPKPKENTPDMVDALLGYVYDRYDLDIEKGERLPPGEVARRGRVAFGFATLAKETPAIETSIIKTAALAPRASFAPFYLSGPVKDWTDESPSNPEGDARLSGRKRYFLRFPTAARDAAATAIEKTLQERDNPNAPDISSRVQLLKPKARGGDLVFVSRIRLHNVLPEELGALLWTLTFGGDPDKPFRHMMGRAKNAGAGQMRVKSLQLSIKANAGEGSDVGKKFIVQPEDWEGRGQGHGEGWLRAGGKSMAPFLRAFEDYMKANCGDANWPDTPDMREYLGLSDPAKGAEIVASGKAGFIPTPNDHGTLRKAVKADSKSDPAPVGKGDRLLRTLTDQLKVVDR